MGHRSRFGTVVICLAALLTAGVAGVHASGVLDPLGTAAPDAPPSGDQLVIHDDAVDYQGDALRGLGLSDHLARADVPPAAAVRAALNDSLVAAGMPAPVADASTHSPGSDPSTGPWLVPAGDLDGDGRADVLGMNIRFQGDSPEQLQVTALRGADGAPLWTRQFVGQTAWAFPAAVRGAAGAIVVTTSLTTTGADAPVADAAKEDLGLRVVALDGRGQAAWTRTWAGSLAYTVVNAIGNRTLTVRTDQAPMTVRLLNADGGPDTDVLVGSEDLALTCSNGPKESCTTASTVRAEVARGEANGATSSRSILTSANGEPQLVAAPDLAGSGHDELLFFSPAASGTTASAFSAASGVPLWTTAGLPAVGHLHYLSVGDTTGAGGTDVVVWSMSTAYSAGHLGTLLQGKTGAVLWSHPLSFPARRAGAAPGGHDAVGGLSVRREAGAIRVRYDLFAVGADAPARTAEYTTAVNSGRRYVVDLFADVGDLDGDGVADAGQRISNYDTVISEFAVSGRTGAKLWSGSLGQPLARDAHGQDLVAWSRQSRDTVAVSRLAGATGRARWTALLSGGPNFKLESADLNGDGVAEVVAEPYSRTRNYDGYAVHAFVLDGRTGRPLWSLAELPTPSNPHTESKGYVTGPVDTGPLPGGAANDCTSTVPSAGGTCFALDGTQRTASFSVADQAGGIGGGIVEGEYRFVGTGVAFPAAASALVPFCGRTPGSVDVPPGAGAVWVYVNATPHNGCPGAQPATAGSITASFT